MQEMFEGARQREETAAGRQALDGLKLKKLTDAEDIEAFLTVFERVMQVRRVPADQWTFFLAPLLTGKEPSWPIHSNECGGFHSV